MSSIFCNFAAHIFFIEHITQFEIKTERKKKVTNIKRSRNVLFTDLLQKYLATAQ